jgi:uncharacterized coiled-coil DUF342 family protein
LEFGKNTSDHRGERTCSNGLRYVNRKKTIEAIIELWENRFLPSIRNEIKAELSELRSEVNVLTAKCKDIETSQQFLSNEFDNFKKIMHDNKKQTADLSKKVNIIETRIEKAE